MSTADWRLDTFVNVGCTLANVHDSPCTSITYIHFMLMFTTDAKNNTFQHSSARTNFVLSPNDKLFLSLFSPFLTLFQPYVRECEKYRATSNHLLKDTAFRGRYDNNIKYFTHSPFFLAVQIVTLQARGSNERHQACKIC